MTYVKQKKASEMLALVSTFVCSNDPRIKRSLGVLRLLGFVDLVSRSAESDHLKCPVDFV